MERKKYNKLIRDKIPEIITQKGGKADIHIADEKEYWDKLKEKLIEEVKEFIIDENEEELADVFEVIDAICEHKSFSKSEIIKKQIKKRAERGAFDKKIILDES